MEINIDKSTIEIPEGLFAKVLARLDLERKALSMRRRFFMAGAFFLGVVGSVTPVWKIFAADISRSGFSQYFSLLFSDSKTVFVNWQDYSLGLLESLPILSTVLFLATVLLFLVAIKYAAKYSKGFSAHRLTN